MKNAVLYGAESEPVELELQLYPEWVDIRVRNGGGRLRMKNLRTRRQDGGRGLEIVDALADSWSIDSGPARNRRHRAARARSSSLARFFASTARWSCSLFMLERPSMSRWRASL